MNHPYSKTHSDNREWLDKVHQQRKERSVSIGIETIEYLIEQGIPVTYHNISQHSKHFDTQEKGIHPNTIKSNDELYTYYKKHSKTYKVNMVRKKLKTPLKFDESNLRKISPNRNIDVVKKKYMKLSKEELVNKLIAVEQYIAENQSRWVANHFEQFK
ncbi:hypothetical protein [Rummeliibacillus pycnus]|uniref:hypothetical protein n=1 Tax=Rummeliibacillus pycnus TaxID=101070 RepID=UPI000C9B5419|nr:hypothetical protein [Rummeliibacillus pycnus]